MTRFPLPVVIFIFYSALFTNVVRVKAYRKFDYGANGLEYLVTEFEKIDLECKNKDLPMAYCGFTHPNGRRYSFSEKDFRTGKCIININITREEVGQWKCYIGFHNIGVETIQTVNVRVVDQLAALWPNVTVDKGQAPELQCVTSKRMMPIRYCRFEPPNGLPFSINPTVSSAMPLNNKYYFPSRLSLDRGECAVAIKKVKEEDAGLWTCGAGFDDDREYVDYIRLIVNDTGVNRVAVIIGSVIGAVILGFAVTAVWKLQKRYCPETISRHRRRIERHEMRPLSVEARVEERLEERVEQLVEERVEERIEDRIEEYFELPVRRRSPARLPLIVVEPATPRRQSTTRLTPLTPTLLQPPILRTGRPKRKSRSYSWADPVSAITYIDEETESPVTMLPRSYDNVYKDAHDTYYV